MNKPVEIKPGERVDYLKGKNLRVIQEAKGYCFSTDSLLLGHFASLHDGDKVVELGAGNGVISLLLTARRKKLAIIALEIRAEEAERARRSVELNQLTETIRVVAGDLRQGPELLGKGWADLVVVNPPYHPTERGMGSHPCRQEMGCSLEEVIQSGAQLLHNNGRLALIHRADRLAEIICIMGTCGLEAKRLQLIQGTAAKKPYGVLVEGKKGAKAGLDILMPLVLQDLQGPTTQLQEMVQGEDEETHE